MVKLGAFWMPQDRHMDELPELLRQKKSDAEIASLWGCTEQDVRMLIAVVQPSLLA